LGSRAIYHDGWKATTDHLDSSIPAERMLIPGSFDFDDDRWSLYCLDEDFTEADDRAGAEPERLRRLVELWWHEAGRNNVLPLVDGILSPLRYEFAARSPPERCRYVYRPGAGRIITPTPFRKGFQLTASIEVAAGSDVSGVICAHHDYLT